MRVLLWLSRDKSALSNIVGYVLLISITIGLSVLVYNWLRFYVGEDDIEECPEGVSVIVRNYECYATNENGAGRLKVILKNKGRFTVDGYILRVHDQPGADFGFYLFDEVGMAIAPGEECEQTYYFGNYSFDGYNISTVTLVEVQPFMTDKGEISCKSYASQDVLCG